MADHASLPRALHIVARLQLLMGLLALAEILVFMTQGRLQLALGVLGIPICFGLLRCSRGWRTCALVMLWVGLLVMPVLFLLGLLGSGSVSLGVLGIAMGRVPRPWMSVAALPAFLFFLWQYRVLVRPDVRRLFLATADSGAPAGDASPAVRGG